MIESVGADGMTRLSGQRAILGEGPWWSADEERLYWVDIPARIVHRVALDGTDHRRWPMPSEVGCVVANRAGGAVVALRDGLSSLDLDSGEVRPLVAVEADRPEHRFNDGKCDRQGRLWFGSMRDDEREPAGALYRYDANGVARILGGIYTSNGLGWSPDGRLMYYTDSQTRQISVFDYDAVTGTLSNQQTFAEDPPDCLPDGLTVDAEGCVWSAKWDGQRLVRYRPDGTVDREIEMPVRRPTSCMFAGPSLRTLVVTSASYGIDPTTDRDSLAGSVFLLDVGVAGLPEAPFSG